MLINNKFEIVFTGMGFYQNVPEEPSNFQLDETCFWLLESCTYFFGEKIKSGRS